MRWSEQTQASSPPRAKEGPLDKWEASWLTRRKGRKSSDGKDGHCLIMAHFTGAERLRADISSICGIALDIESKYELYADATDPALYFDKIAALGLRAIAYNSHSDGRKFDSKGRQIHGRRWRLVLPFDDVEGTPEELQEMHSTLVQGLAEAIDLPRGAIDVPASRDIARLWYTARCRCKFSDLQPWTKKWDGPLVEPGHFAVEKLWGGTSRGGGNGEASIGDWDITTDFSRPFPAPEGCDDDVEYSLSRLDPTPRDNWLRAGMALHADDESPDGIAKKTWDAWSSTSKSYDEHDQGRVWASFGERERKITLHSLHSALGRRIGAYRQATDLLPLDTARAKTKEIITEATYKVGHHVVKVTPGVGKTTAAIAAFRESDHPLRVFALPTRDLATEVADKIGVAAKLFLGRTPAQGDFECREFDKYSKLQAISQKRAGQFCGKECRSRSTCPWVDNAEALDTGMGTVVTTHQLAFSRLARHRLPARIGWRRLAAQICNRKKKQVLWVKGGRDLIAKDAWYCVDRGGDFGHAAPIFEDPSWSDVQALLSIGAPINSLTNDEDKCSKEAAEIVKAWAYDVHKVTTDDELVAKLAHNSFDGALIVIDEDCSPAALPIHQISLQQLENAYSAGVLRCDAEHWDSLGLEASCGPQSDHLPDGEGIRLDQERISDLFAEIHRDIEQELDVATKWPNIDRLPDFLAQLGTTARPVVDDLDQISAWRYFAKKSLPTTQLGDTVLYLDGSAQKEIYRAIEPTSTYQQVAAMPGAYVVTATIDGGSSRFDDQSKLVEMANSVSDEDMRRALLVGHKRSYSSPLANAFIDRSGDVIWHGGTLARGSNRFEDARVLFLLDWHVPRSAKEELRDLIEHHSSEEITRSTLDLICEKHLELEPAVQAVHRSRVVNRQTESQKLDLVLPLRVAGYMGLRVAASVTMPENGDTFERPRKLRDALLAISTQEPSRLSFVPTAAMAEHCEETLASAVLSGRRHRQYRDKLAEYGINAWEVSDEKSSFKYGFILGCMDFDSNQVYQATLKLSAHLGTSLAYKVA